MDVQLVDLRAVRQVPRVRVLLRTVREGDRRAKVELAVVHWRHLLSSGWKGVERMGVGRSGLGRGREWSIFMRPTMSPCGAGRGIGCYSARGCGLDWAGRMVMGRGSGKGDRFSGMVRGVDDVGWRLSRTGLCMAAECLQLIYEDAVAYYGGMGSTAEGRWRLVGWPRDGSVLSGFRDFGGRRRVMAAGTRG